VAPEVEEAIRAARAADEGQLAIARDLRVGVAGLAGHAADQSKSS
jgi:hypothetical protein